MSQASAARTDSINEGEREPGTVNSKPWSPAVPPKAGKPVDGRQRFYRRLTRCEHLVAFHVVVKETDLWVQAHKNLKNLIKELILKERGYIESYIRRHPDFQQTLHPWRLEAPAAAILSEMAQAGTQAGVGPMAAVAGAIAGRVGNRLLDHPQGSDEVIIENGGDVFLKTRQPVTVGISAGKSPLSMQIGLTIDSRERPVAVCTSSGTVGHSISFGKADAVCVVSGSAALADAAATSIGNRVHAKADIHKGIDFGKTIQGVEGLVIVKDEKMALWGALEMVPLKK